MISRMMMDFIFSRPSLELYLLGWGEASNILIGFVEGIKLKHVL